MRRSAARRPELDETYRDCSLESIVCPCQPMVSFASINGIKSLFFTENNPLMFYGQEKAVVEMIPFHFAAFPHAKGKEQEGYCIQMV